MADPLARKIALIAEECAYVQKDGRNDFHKYRYASAAAVLAKVNEAMAKHGVCSTVDPEVLSESDNAGNRTVTVKVKLTLHDADSEQTLTTAGIGCGQDKGDKAVMKAQTAAIKYAWMLALNISTGDDPEADEETDKRAHQPPRTTRTEAAPDRSGAQGEAPATGPAPGRATPPPFPESDLATPPQVRAIYLMGRDQHAMSDGDVDERSVELYGLRPAELSKKQASGFIAVLKGGQPQPATQPGAPIPEASHPAAKPGRNPALLDIWAQVEYAAEKLREVKTKPPPLPPDEADAHALESYLGQCRRIYAAKRDEAKAAR